MLPSVFATNLIEGLKNYLNVNNLNHKDEFSNTINDFIEKEGNLFKGPYISINLPFRQGNNSGKEYFPAILGDDFIPYSHQEKAFKRLKHDKLLSTLIATGTGSGKTEAFMYPILDYCLHNKKPGIKAIIIYPMNALATDQAKRFANVIYHTQQLKSNIRVGLYIGGDENNANLVMKEEGVITDKYILRDNPPDILLTNYKMLDYLLMKVINQGLWKNNYANGVFRYLVVDELHSFDGAQGTDLASLLRRLKYRLKTNSHPIACIGTSATLGTANKSHIIDFAKIVFNEDFDDDSLIIEDRLTIDEWLQNCGDVFHYPTYEDYLNSNENHNDLESYISEIYSLWFPHKNHVNVNDDEFKIKLSIELKQLVIVKKLLHNLNSQSIDRNFIVEQLQRMLGSLNSDKEYLLWLIDTLLSLIAWARDSIDGKRLKPFLNLKVQLWVRELANIVSMVSKRPTLEFDINVANNQKSLSFPVIYCVECNLMGWVGYRSNDKIENDLDKIYNYFFKQKTGYHNLCYMYINKSDYEQYKNDDRFTFREFTNLEITDLKDVDDVIIEFRPMSTPSKENDKKSEINHCFRCNEHNKLFIWGTRAARLLSVLIHQNFASLYNNTDNNKLITFSDSVQDAAFRAAYFLSANYQFTMRTALMKVLKNSKQMINLTNLPDIFEHYWMNEFNNDQKSYISSFIAPDMEANTDYVFLLDKDKIPQNSELRSYVNKRIQWFAFSEFTFRYNIGRTLEHAGCAVSFVSLEDINDNDFKVLLEQVKNLGDMLRDISIKSLKEFLYGVLLHMKKLGSINLPILDQYRKDKKIYYLNNTKDSIYYMPKINNQSYFVKFLDINIKKNTWTLSWGKKNFKNLDDYSYEQIYKICFDFLVQQNIIDKKSHKSGFNYAIDIEKLIISTLINKIKCNKCNDELNVPTNHNLVNMHCLIKMCNGKYEQLDNSNLEKRKYYANLYKNSHLNRLLAKEHTGLLSRTDREKVENDFIKRGANEAWKPNILSATPTLEMGIDIGDLNSVFLCSVPPNTSNYVQRVGRAGRKDGNIFNLTLANNKDYDLDFFNDPLFMIDGEITPPGVFLDASAILQRQFLAFCIDCWSYKNLNKLNLIPKNLRLFIKNIDDEGSFPKNLINFINSNNKNLLSEFLSMYEHDITNSTKSELEKLVLGDYNITVRVLEKFSNARKKLIDYNDKLNSIKKDESISTEQKQEEEFLYEYLKNSINEKNTFEFLTIEGLLPNYAFPEDIITLHSIVVNNKKKSNDYDRAAKNAIREFAPLNNFFVNGQKIKITNLDIKSMNLTQFRICHDCMYLEKISSSTIKTIKKCPKCQSSLWSEIGRTVKAIRLEQMIAYNGIENTYIDDTNEDRSKNKYATKLFINFNNNDIEEAYRINDEETPFAFEYINKVDFKEFNLGIKGSEDKITLAGEELTVNHFQICEGCGAFKDIRHSGNCKKESNNYIKSFLYREFSADAIRLLIPFLNFDISKQNTESLIAAVKLGLRLYYNGKVDHLGVEYYKEQDNEAKGMTKGYIVLYDNILGGSGYLKQLMQDKNKVLSILQLAYDKLKQCSCNLDIKNDGCYKCIYHYNLGYSLSSVSSQLAKIELEKILKHTELTKINKIIDINLEVSITTKLEKLFLELLFRENNIKYEKKVNIDGNEVYKFNFADYQYEITPQVELNKRDGVCKTSRPDFIIHPIDNNDLLPIAVFVDGYEYHKDILNEDSLKRMAIAYSNNYKVFSITYSDLIDKYYNNFHFNSNDEKLKKLENLNNFKILTQILTQGNTKNIELQTQELSLLIKNNKVVNGNDYANFNEIFKDIFKTNDDLDSQFKTLFNYLENKDKLRFIIKTVDILTIIIVLKDSVKNIILYVNDIETISREQLTGILKMYNILHLNYSIQFITQKGIDIGQYYNFDFFIQNDYNNKLTEIYEVMPQLKEVIISLINANLINEIPDYSYDVVNEDGSISDVRFDLAWENHKVAYMIDYKFVTGWTIFGAQQIEELINKLKEISNE